VKGLQVISLPGAELGFIEHCPLPLDKDTLLQQLIETIPWEQKEVSVYGKTFAQPRLIAWYGDAGCAYTYSGIRNEPLAWTPLLRSVKDKVEETAGCTFNSVLLNYYRDHNDSIGLHSDDEDELGKWPAIASLSLGSTRVMKFVAKRPSANSDAPSARQLFLTHGSLLVMSGPTQENWKHGIAKTKVPTGPRVNLTFRKIYPVNENF
jgi:alkylated DNA repair dioxygenase AlkB